MSVPDLNNLNSYLDQYQNRLLIEGDMNEAYKWEAIDHFQQNWNIEAEDFKEMFQESFRKVGNLLYQNSWGFISKAVIHFPEEVKEWFLDLYNENIPLEEKIKLFRKKAKSLIPELQERTGKAKLNSQQDERTISVYLSFRFPEKYFLYKTKFYQRLCDQLEIKTENTDQRYQHFLEIAVNIKKDLINNNEELIQIHKQIFPKVSWDDGNLITQNFLYVSFEKDEKEEERDVNYWIFQCNPEIYDLKNALKANAVNSWTVAAHKNKIKPKDKVIIWQTGSNAGCLALGEVLTFPAFVEQTAEERKFYNGELKDTDGTRVKMKILQDFVNDPVLWTDIKELPEFQNFKGGNQGTNFSATKEEYNILMNMNGKENNQEIEFNNIISRLDNTEILKYFNMLDEIKEKLNLVPGDERIDFSTASNKLGLVVGNRYCWNIKPVKNSKIYFSISPQKLIESSTPFGRKTPLAFSTESEDYEIYKRNSDLIIAGIKNELDRTNVTRHKRNNEFFEKAVFNLNFRREILGYEKPMSMKNNSLNTILYGPPGTGKTYQLQNTYFKEFTVQETSLNREQYLENIVSDLKWWQVAAIALLDLKRSKVTDIVSHELLLIKIKLSNSKNPNATIWGYLQHYTDPECEYVKVADRSSNPIFYKDQNSFWEVKEDLLEQFYPEAFSILEEVKNYHPNPDKLIKNYEFVTFHQSFSYEDFIEGIKPNLEEEENNVSYKIEDGIFKKMCLKADADRENRYALFIDEINRGNVSAIFGELITLIEDDKRLGEENELRAKLPYSKTDLGVPPNLHIFGTMNTADRSVEALDTALRRRFTFKEIMPLPHLLSNISFNGFYLDEILETINKRIEALLDRDHTIGHSYFIKIGSGDTAALTEVFQNKIIPLLQEYFYHDYEKIALILGEGFVEKKEGKVEFAKFRQLEDPEINPSYELKKGIEDIEAALRKLLNRKDEAAE